jgi:hypothetical protein
MPKPNLTPSQAQQLLSRYHAGTLSQDAFCRKHRVSPSLFSYWLPRSRPPVAPVKPLFQEVALPPPPSSHRPCLLTLPSGARLEFPAALLRETLVMLAGLEAAC